MQEYLGNSELGGVRKFALTQMRYEAIIYICVIYVARYNDNKCFILSNVL